MIVGGLANAGRHEGEGPKCTENSPEWTTIIASLTRRTRLRIKRAHGCCEFYEPRRERQPEAGPQAVRRERLAANDYAAESVAVAVSLRGMQQVQPVRGGKIWGVIPAPKLHDSRWNMRRVGAPGEQEPHHS